MSDNVDSLLNGNDLITRLNAYLGLGGDRKIVARGPVTTDAIRLVTDVTGDKSPIYSDANYAAASIHGGIVAPPSSVLWWHRRLFEPVSTSDWIDEQNTRRFRLDPNPARQVGVRETELGLLAEVIQILAEAGYSSVAVTNSDTTIRRYPRVGDLLTCFGPKIEAIVGPKKTGLGEGFFTTSEYVLRDDANDIVAKWRTTRLHFAPR